MNRCVLKTFGRKMAVGTWKSVGVGAAVVGVMAIPAVAFMSIPNRWLFVIGECFKLLGFLLLALVPGAMVGALISDVLEESYRECSK